MQGVSSCSWGENKVELVINAIPPRLAEIFSTLPQFAIAYSGGLDSRFLIHAALAHGCHVVAIHATGPHIARADTGFARQWAASRNLEYHEIAINPLERPEILANGRERCYFCKKALICRLRDFLDELGYGRLPLCDGGNASDHNGWRPGLKAVAEAGVISPLALAGMDKAAIRKTAHSTAMDNPDQKARPCMLTRYAYGLAPDAQTMLRLARTEEEIGKHISDPHTDFRLRLLPAPELHMTSLQPGYLPGLRTILEKNGFGGTNIRILQSLSGFFDRLP